MTPKLDQGARAGLRIALFFLVLGGLWILLSDRAIAGIARDPDTLTHFQTLKGWVFVLGTSLLLFVQVARVVRGRLEQEERFHRLADNLPDLVYRYRLVPDLAFEYVSQAALRMTGWGPEDFARQPSLAVHLVHPGDRHLLDALARGEADPAEPLVLRWIRKDGATVWVEQRNVPVRDADGRVVAVEGSARDITRQREAAQASAEERTLLEQIMGTSPVGITFLDPRGRIVFANAFAERLFGLTRSEIAGQAYNATTWSISAPDGGVFPDEELPFRRVMATGRPVEDVRHAISTAGGPRVLLSVNAAPIKGEDGAILGVVALIEDITQRVADQQDRERAEAQLAQAQRLESVGRLAGGIAHDFNNMLSVITLGTEMALRDVAADSEAATELKDIQHAAQRSADLTRQLLAFSRKQVISPRAVNLNKAVADQENLLQRLIGEDVEIHLDLRAGLWDVFLDPSQVDQILTNLMVNARDAIRGTGTVTIRTDNVRLDGTQARDDLPIEAGDFVLLSVTDSGHGMSAEVLERVFDPFFTTKPPGEGTGLGLSTVYGIVKQNGGVIHAESEPGKGTCMRIYLPRLLAASARDEAPARTPSAGDETVLAVEDEEMILNLVRRSLERCGYRVLAALGPQEALAAAERHDGPIHLLLTDVVMPGMNGKQLEERLREMRPTIRTLFMSGYPASVIAERGVVEEGVAFLQKPFTPVALAQRVREVLDARA